jgi:hypothetical protein
MGSGVGPVLMITRPERGASSGDHAQSVELVVPIEGGGSFCLHFGGGLEIASAERQLWIGAGDAEDQTTLGPFFDLIGEEIMSAQVEADGQLLLDLTGGSQLRAAEGRWEAHWPDASASYDDRWVPREGPNIP